MRIPRFNILPFCLLSLLANTSLSIAANQYSSDWEDLEVSPVDWTVESVAPGTLTDIGISTTHAKSGVQSLRSFIQNPDEVSGIKRAELRHNINAKVGEQYLYRFSLYLPDNEQESFPINQNDAVRFHNIIVQWHGTKDLGEEYRSPNLSFHINDDGKLQFRGITSDLPISPKGESDIFSYVGLHGETSFDIPTNQWVTFEVSVLWDYAKDGQGFLKISMDDQQLVDYEGPTCYNDVIGPYFKMGIYRPSYFKTAATVYYDDFEMKLGESR